MKRKKIILITIFTSFSLVLESCFKRSPAYTTEKFIRLMDRGKINEAMTLLSANSNQLLNKDKIPLALYKGVKVLQKPDRLKSFKVNNQIVIGDFATVRYTMKHKDGSQDTGLFKLIKKDGEWKITP